jgi:hypothetical protein
MEGDWIKIFSYEGEFVYGVLWQVYGYSPLWYLEENDALFDQYLWTDEGSSLDYSAGYTEWTTTGYDAGKHYFFA